MKSILKIIICCVCMHCAFQAQLAKTLAMPLGNNAKDLPSYEFVGWAMAGTRNIFLTSEKGKFIKPPRAGNEDFLYANPDMTGSESLLSGISTAQHHFLPMATSHI